MAFYATKSTTEVPEKDNGELYPMAVVFPRETIFADTYDDVVEHLIPEYPKEQDTEEKIQRADALRFAYAVHAANELQEEFLGKAIVENFINEGAEDFIKFIVSGDRGQYIAVPGNEWNFPQLPLALLTVFYAPYTDEEKPTGEIVWIDPVSEKSLVDSVAVAFGGVVRERRPR